MASVKDTATFFTEGSANQFEHVLSLYPQALRLKAERKNKKPEELIKLDNWYQNELPKKIKSRGKEAHLIHEELVQLMKWKQARGKFYPQLSYLIKVNTPRAVMAETKKAFRKLPNLEHAINALSNLKGVGTTMASALLAAAAPDRAPFMADECLMAIPDIEGIDYTTKEYLNFVTHIQNTVERLNKESSNGWWSPHRVELALWTHYIASELKPELLDGIPNGTTITPHHNGDANSNNSTQDALKNNPTQPHSDGLELECSDESNTTTECTASAANGADSAPSVGAEGNGDRRTATTALEDPSVDETTTTSFPEEEDSLPPSVSASVSASASASDQDSTSLQEEPPTKKTKHDK